MEDNTSLATEICRHLEGYRPKADHCRGVNISLEHESGDGRSIFIVTQDRKKWEASVTWPHERGTWYEPDEKSKHIGVSKHRGAEALADGITKRLLPVYHEEYPKQLARLQAHRDRQARHIALRDELLEMIDPGRERAEHMKDATQLPVYNCGLRRLSVSAGEADEVELQTTYLPADVARKVIQLLIDEGLREER